MRRSARNLPVSRDVRDLVVLLSHELHEERRRNASLQALADTDPLTRLPNRRCFWRVWDGLAKKAAHYAVFMMDVDHFKKINDVHGHTVGDSVLQEVAQRLSGAVRSNALLARYGGEEFILVLPNADLAQCEVVAQRILRKIGRSKFTVRTGHKELELKVTLSLGVAFTRRGVSRGQAAKHADEALYAAKNAGRNRVCFYADTAK